MRITQGDIEAARRDAQRPPQHYGGGFGRPGGGPELALGPAVDVEQLGKDVERAQVGGLVGGLRELGGWMGLLACCAADQRAAAQLLQSRVPPPTRALSRPPLSPRQAALDKLPGELKAQQANAAAVEARLQREKGGWVLEGHAARVALPREFAQHCVLPRMLNSPTDAIYCARFLK